MDKQAIYEKLMAYLCEMFEVPGEKITPAALLEDLDLDSIDAIDLIVKLQEMTGKKIKAQEFRSVRTVQDVVDKVHTLYGGDG
ncbi:MAG: acyl carrier protein [Defluviicoccus sp.]|nr:MAG: acyl carrier protein [Defluviicoccus sp.]